jgi:hypothetical protein
LLLLQQLLLLHYYNTNNNNNNNNKSKGKGKGKEIPLQALTGPQGSRRLFEDFKTIGHESGKVVSPKHRPPLPPVNIPGAHFCYESESTPAP